MCPIFFYTYFCGGISGSCDGVSGSGGRVSGTRRGGSEERSGSLPPKISCPGMGIPLRIEVAPIETVETVLVEVVSVKGS